MKYNEKPEEIKDKYKVTISKEIRPGARGLEALVPTQIVLKVEKIEPEHKAYGNVNYR